MAYVYRHIKKTNNEIFYIGIGSDGLGTYTRAYTKYGRSRNTHWQNVVNKHGYYIEITHDNIIWEEACFIEKYLILFYGRRDLGTGTLVNKTEGGEGVVGTVVTDEKRKKLSDGKKGEKHPMFGKNLSTETKKRISDGNKGKILSFEHKKRISEYMKGKSAYNKGIPMTKMQYENMLKRAENFKVQVIKYSIEGCLINKYSSVIEAAKNNNLNQGNITNAVNNEVMYGGFIWRYVKGEIALTIESYNIRVKRVLQYSLNNDFIAEYDSAMDAARKNNFQKSSILRVCNLKYKQAYGFKWAFKIQINEQKNASITAEAC